MEMLDQSFRAALQIEESTAKKSWMFLLGGKKLLVLDDFMIRQRSRGNLRVPFDEDYSACKRRFTDYFSERRYIEKFRQIVQVDGENFEIFVARLRSGSKLCQFNNDPNEEIKRQSPLEQDLLRFVRKHSTVAAA